MREKVCRVKLAVLSLVWLGCAAGGAAQKLELPGWLYGRYFVNAPITAGDRGSVAIAFEAFGASDAHIAFAERPEHNSPLYEVLLGGWNNTKSVIRKGSQGAVRAEVDAVRRRDAVLNGANVPAAFWIRVERGLVEVGSGRVIGAQGFLSWQDPDPLRSPRYIGFSTWTAPVRYEVTQLVPRPFVGEHPSWNALPVVECESGHTYGRGAGFGYVPLFEERKDARKRCEKEHGACEIWGEMYYPKCKGGYAPAGCCLCRCFL